VVATKSVFCIATAKYLTNKLKKYNANTYEIPLGVSIDNAVSVEKRSNHQNKRIVVGLMGFINKRKISLQAINKIIQDHRFYLVLIGPVEKSFLRDLKNTENIKLTGLLKGKELTKELRKIDIGIALYNLKRINPGTTPNKMWQYLSQGKPSIVSKLPNLNVNSYPEKTVYVLENEDKLVDTILKAFSEDTPLLQKKRIEFAKNNTWDHRFEKFMTVYDNHLWSNHDQ
jgi:hypothetical protein